MTLLRLVLHAVSDVSLFVSGVDQFQSQDSFRNVVCVESLFSYDPSITCVGHIELSCISKYDPSIDFATKTKTKLRSTLQAVEYSYLA